MRTKFLLPLAFIAFTVISCHQEKLASKTVEKSVFAQQRSTPPYFFLGLPDVATQGSNSINGNQSPLAELQRNQIPLQLPNADYPDWQKFYFYYKSKENELSNDAILRCAVLLLRSYNLTRETSPRAREAVVETLELLTANKYANYEVLYTYLSWMKQHDKKAFAQLKNRVLDYAQPLYSEGSAKQPDSPVFNENPEIKKQMVAVLETVKQNDAFIEKIRML